MNNAYLRDALLVSGGVVLGGGTAVLITKKVLERKYENLLFDEVHSIRESYRKAAEARMKPDLDELREYAAKDVLMTAELFQDIQVQEKSEDELREDAIEAAQKYTDAVVGETFEKEEVRRHSEAGSVEDIDDDIDEEARLLENSREARIAAGAAMVHNVFTDPRSKHPLGDASSEPEEDKTKPYVIAVEEFLDNDPPYDKITITYFEGDDTLIDDREQIIDDVEGTIGRDKLDRFGDRSQDDTIVYVRNDNRAADFEVIKDDGYYSVTVLGMSLDEVEQKPQKKRPKKMRDDD